MRTRLGIIFVLLILFLTIIAQNTQDVTIQAYFWSVTLPSFAVFGLTLCVGLIIGGTARATVATRQEGVRPDPGDQETRGTRPSGQEGRRVALPCGRGPSRSPHPPFRVL